MLSSLSLPYRQIQPKLLFPSIQSYLAPLDGSSAVSSAELWTPHHHAAMALRFLRTDRPPIAEVDPAVRQTAIAANSTKNRTPVRPLVYLRELAIPIESR